MNKIERDKFRRTVWRYYRAHGRDLPWRDTANPYAILISEVMLQQTQVDRVIPKYEAWLRRFPDIASLAQASLADVLGLWQGLGYNRRALNVQRCAQALVRHHGGSLPTNEAELRALPGIGPYTAAAIMAFAHNQPTIMIETNIRTVFLHHFFPDQKEVADAEILPLIIDTVSKRQPRKWYWALMDYGSYLKQQHGNSSRRSKHYAKQSAFAGSNRQVRGKIIKLLTVQRTVPYDALARELEVDEVAMRQALKQLEKEGLVVQRRGSITIASAV